MIVNGRWMMERQVKTEPFRQGVPDQSRKNGADGQLTFRADIEQPAFERQSNCQPGENIGSCPHRSFAQCFGRAKRSLDQPFISLKWVSANERR